MQSLNQQFLKKNYVTDVLSFSSNQNNCFGELAICLSQIKLQAKAHGLAPEKELAYMVLHGVLHLLGYRHEGGGPLAKKCIKFKMTFLTNGVKKICRTSKTEVLNELVDTTYRH